MTIEFWWRQIFKISIIHKPSLLSHDVPQKIWARSVQPFWRLLDTNRQTNRQTDKPNLYIDGVCVCFYVKKQKFEFIIFGHNPRKEPIFVFLNLQKTVFSFSICTIFSLFFVISFYFLNFYYHLDNLILYWIISKL